MCVWFFFFQCEKWNPLHFIRSTHYWKFCWFPCLLSLSLSTPGAYITTNGNESSQGRERLKYRYVTSPGNGSGLACEKRGQDAAWEKGKPASGIAAFVFHTFLFSKHTHIKKKKKILTSHCTAWLVRLLVTVITILQPWCKQRERRADFSEWTDGKYFSLLSSSYLRDYNKHKYEFNTLINDCFLPICPFPTFFFFFVSPFCSLNL